MSETTDSSEQFSRSLPDLPYARPYWDGEEATALNAALSTGMWTNGSQVAAFEHELERLTGAPTATLSSGTGALYAVLHVLDQRRAGPKLLVSPTVNFAAAPASARLLGWDVALCDVEEDGLTLAPESLRAVLEDLHRSYAVIVVLPVHYAGHTADMPSIAAACEQYGALLVEDACHAIGARYTGTHRPVGSWPGSVAACFSFHPTKPVSSGEGGAVASADEALLAAVRELRNHRMVPAGEHDRDMGPWPYTITVPGMNLRLSEFNAAVGVVQARRAEESRSERMRLAALYHRALARLPSVRPVPGSLRGESAHHLLPVVFDTPELGVSKPGLLAGFFDRGIRCQVHYTPLHLLPAFSGSLSAPGEFPVADRAFRGLVSLPLWRGMTESDVERVTDAVSAVTGTAGQRPDPGPAAEPRPTAGTPPHTTATERSRRA